MNSELPNFFLIGAPRSGTTSIYAWLGQHPQVFVPRCKEPGYFAFEDGSPQETVPVHDEYIHNSSDYHKLFQGSANAKAVGEASTVYFQVPEAPCRIKASVPEARLIVSLRNPAERAFSHFLLHRMDRSEPCEKFADALNDERRRAAEGWKISFNYTLPGFYARHLNNYLQNFDEKQILVLFLEDFTKDPATEIAKICRHIGVDDGFCFDTSRVHNSSGVARFPGMTEMIHKSIKKLGWVGKVMPSKLRKDMTIGLRNLGVDEGKLQVTDRERLIDLYRNDILHLQEMTGRDLSHWLTVPRS